LFAMNCYEMLKQFKIQKSPAVPGEKIKGKLRGEMVRQAHAIIQSRLSHVFRKFGLK
jgi:hypothetical protein